MRRAQWLRAHRQVLAIDCRVADRLQFRECKVDEIRSDRDESLAELSDLVVQAIAIHQSRRKCKTAAQRICRMIPDLQWCPFFPCFEKTTRGPFLLMATGVWVIITGS